jgi:hypothetical protein
MKIVAYCLFALAAVGTLVAINNVFLGGGRNRPEGVENLAGYAVGSFLFPLSLVIVGLILLRKQKNKVYRDDT